MRELLRRVRDGSSDDATIHRWVCCFLETVLFLVTRIGYLFTRERKREKKNSSIILQTRVIITVHTYVLKILS